MKNPESPCRENADDELHHYLHERPGLLLKMLDIAETCWHEHGEPAVSPGLLTASAVAAPGLALEPVSA